MVLEGAHSRISMGEGHRSVGTSEAERTVDSASERRTGTGVGGSPSRLPARGEP
ncbi:hypothetical protein [Natronococcus roseus]|uniref:hypothetical protein n=1 Tax=Natronococcus roseus TaxID=1052014 RepID=UPI00374D77C4